MRLIVEEADSKIDIGDIESNVWYCGSIHDEYVIIMRHRGNYIIIGEDGIAESYEPDHAILPAISNIREFIGSFTIECYGDKK